MICPFCQRPVKEFTPPTADRGLRCPLPDCPGADFDVPPLYPREYDTHPAVAVSLMGPTGHGKTVFTEALLAHLEQSVRWPGFSCQWMDQARMREVRERLRVLRSTGELPQFTERVFPYPKVLRLRNVPRIGGCQLLFFDTSGESFQEVETLAEAGRFVRNSPGVLWLVSLTELEYPEQLSDLMTVYAEAMAKMGGDTRRQTLVLVLTKGDLYLDRGGWPAEVREAIPADLPAEAKAFLADDDLDPAGDAWGRLDALSESLSRWLEGTQFRNAFNILRSQFLTVRVCVVSAQGAASKNGQLQMRLAPRGVMAPLFWLWREARPGAWVTAADGSRKLYLDVAAAVAATPPGGTVTLDPGTHALTDVLKLGRPITLVGGGRDVTTLTSVAAKCVVAIKSEGVTLRDLTVQHTGSSPADPMRVLGGRLNLDGVRLTGGVAGPPDATGNGLTVAGGTVVGVDCELTGNAANGAAVCGPAAALHTDRCRFDRNGHSGAAVTDGTVEARGGGAAANGRYGLYGRGGRLTAVAVECRSNGQSGVRLTEAARGSLERVDCEANTRIGIEVYGQAQVAAVGCRAIGHAVAGVSLGGAASGGVSGGTFSENRSGIEVGEAATPVLDGNSCSANRGAGIRYGGQAGGTCVNNKLTGNAGPGLQVDGSASPLVQGNTFTGNAGGPERIGSQASVRRVVPAATEVTPDQPITLAKPRRRGWFG